MFLLLFNGQECDFLNNASCRVISGRKKNRKKLRKIQEKLRKIKKNSGSSTKQSVYCAAFVIDTTRDTLSV